MACPHPEDATAVSLTDSVFATSGHVEMDMTEDVSAGIDGSFGSALNDSGHLIINQNPNEPLPLLLNQEEEEIKEQLKDLRKIRDFLKTHKQELVSCTDEETLDEWIMQLEKGINFDFENLKTESLLVSSSPPQLNELLDNPILSDIAKVLHEKEEYQMALKLLEIIYRRVDSVYGPENPSTLKALFRIGLCLSNLRQYEDAMDLYRALYKKQKENWNLLGPNHEDTLRTLHNIALIFQAQENYPEALKKFEKVFHRRNSTLGSDHPLSINAQFQIALCLGNLKNYTRALEQFKLVYDKYSIGLGPNHAETLATQNNIAVILVNLEMYAEALRSYQSVYEIEVTLFGVDHPFTLNTKENMERVSKKMELQI